MAQESNSRKIRKIRDVVHDYIEITSIENLIINTPEFQRLRYISQNSLAYYTYPSNTTSRFSHSLGVMHLGGKLFTKALENSSSETLNQFLSDCEMLIQKICESKSEKDTFFKNWIKYFGNISNFNHHPVDLSEPTWFEDSNKLAVINIMWQSVRIACLVHDIGHFPYSHLFEHAIQNLLKGSDNEQKFVSKIGDFIKGQEKEYLEFYKKQPVLNDLNENFADEPKLHEVNGVLVLKELELPRLEEESIVHDIAKLTLKIGRIIFIYNRTNYGLKQSENNILNSLHAIVSSEIDADRLDYCVRDPNASGMELGAIDFKRIIDSIILLKDTSTNEFKIAYMLNGASAIESFFHQRYLMYENLIYHHNVARFDAVLEHSLGLILKLYSKHEFVKSELDSFGFVEENGASLTILKKFSWVNYDDYWLKTLLNRLYSRIKNLDKDLELVNLKMCLEIVLFRKNQHLFSIWKRNDDLIEDLNRIIDTLKTQKGSEIDLKLVIYYLKEILNGKSIDSKITMSKLKKELSSLGVMIIVKRVEKKIFADTEFKRVEIVNSNKKLKPAFEISDYLQSLKLNTEKSLDFNIFFIGNEIKINKELITNSRSILINNLMESIIKLNQKK